MKNAIQTPSRCSGPYGKEQDSVHLGFSTSITTIVGRARRVFEELKGMFCCAGIHFRGHTIQTLGVSILFLDTGSSL